MSDSSGFPNGPTIQAHLTLLNCYLITNKLLEKGRKRVINKLLLHTSGTVVNDKLRLCPQFPSISGRRELFMGSGTLISSPNATANRVPFRHTSPRTSSSLRSQPAPYSAGETMEYPSLPSSLTTVAQTTRDSGSRTFPAGPRSS